MRILGVETEIVPIYHIFYSSSVKYTGVRFHFIVIYLVFLILIQLVVSSAARNQGRRKSAGSALSTRGKDIIYLSRRGRKRGGHIPFIYNDLVSICLEQFNYQ